MVQILVVHQPFDESQPWAVRIMFKTLTGIEYQRSLSNIKSKAFFPNPCSLYHLQHPEKKIEHTQRNLKNIKSQILLPQETRETPTKDRIPHSYRLRESR